MECNKVREMLSAYADGEIKGRMVSELRAHIEQCASCRAQLEALKVLQFKLNEMMSEPLASIDVSGQVMSSLLVQRKFTPVRWVWALTGGTLLLAILFRWVFMPSIKIRNTSQMAKGHSTLHSIPQPSTPKQLMLPNNRAIARAFTKPEIRDQQLAPVPKAHRHVSIRIIEHKRVRKAPQPIRQPESSQASQTAMNSEKISTRVETTIAATVGNNILSQMKPLVIELAPNDNAAVNRPPLEVVKISGSTVMEMNGG